MADTWWSGKKSVAFSAVLLGLLVFPFSFAVTLALGYSCYWFLIPVFPIEMLLYKWGFVRDWGFFAVGAGRLSLVFFCVLVANRRARVISLIVVVQTIAAVWAYLQRQ